MEAILFKLVEWLFGLVSPGMRERIAAPYERDRLKTGITRELADLHITYVHLVFQIAVRRGGLDAALIRWAIGELAHQPDANQGMQSALRALLNKGDDEIAKYQAAGMLTHAGSLGMKTYDVPYIKSNPQYMAALDEQWAPSVRNIERRIDLVNQDIEEAQGLHARTFESLSPENHQIIVDNLAAKYLQIRDKAKDLVDAISSLIYPAGAS